MVYSSLESSLNYIVDSIYSMEEKEEIEKTIEKIANNLSLNIN